VHENKIAHETSGQQQLASRVYKRRDRPEQRREIKSPTEEREWRLTELATRFGAQDRATSMLSALEELHQQHHWHYLAVEKQ